MIGAARGGGRVAATGACAVGPPFSVLTLLSGGEATSGGNSWRESSWCGNCGYGAGGGSINTGVRSPSSATGTLHWKASSRPLTGETGSQRSDTYPSAVQPGSSAAL